MSVPFSDRNLSDELVMDNRSISYRCSFVLYYSLTLSPQAIIPYSKKIIEHLCTFSSLLHYLCSYK